MLTGMPYDYSVDYWMIGAVLYELVFKKRPFSNGKSIEDLINNIKSGKIRCMKFKRYAKNPKDSDELYIPTPEYISLIAGLL